jgi:hypothetical protein
MSIADLALGQAKPGSASTPTPAWSACPCKRSGAIPSGATKYKTAVPYGMTFSVGNAVAEKQNGRRDTAAVWF